MRQFILLRSDFGNTNTNPPRRSRPLRLLYMPLRALFIVVPILSMFSVIALAGQRPVNQTLWVSTAVTAGGQFFGIPITEQKSTNPELKIYFSNDQSAYVTIAGERGNSQGLVLPPNSTISTTRDQSGTNITVEIGGNSPILNIKYAIRHAPLPSSDYNNRNNVNVDVYSDWTVDIRNGNCTVLDKHFSVSTNNPLVNALFAQTVGGASCKLYPGRPFL